MATSESDEPAVDERRRRLLLGTVMGGAIGGAGAFGLTASGSARAAAAGQATAEREPVPPEVFVMDSTVHAYSFAEDNARYEGLPQQLAEALYHGMHRGWSPRGEPKWILEQARYMAGANPELLAHALFAESRTDACIYHGVPTWGMFEDGGSPLWAGAELRRRYPGRVELYGPVSPWQEDPLEEIDRLVEEEGVIGLKLYPMDIVDGRMRSYRLDDPEVAFPLIERARDRGLRSIAIHKAIPLGQVPMKPFKVGDVDEAAIAFPDMRFEIVHGGFAFLEETAMQLMRFPNVVVNLEGGSAFLCNAPRRFAELVGTFLAVGGEDRIVWSVGTVALHPRPFLEAFWALEMPEDLLEYGFPPLTREIKEKILGRNHARLLGLDVEAMRARHRDDRFARMSGLAEPWSG